MGIFDQAKDLASEHSDKVEGVVDAAVEKAGDIVDEKTGGKFADKVDQVQEMAEKKADDLLD